MSYERMIDDAMLREFHKQQKQINENILKALENFEKRIDKLEKKSVKPKPIWDDDLGGIRK